MDPKTRLKQWLASGQARLQPLTFPQRELWENSPVPAGDPANHVCSFFEIQGPITFEQCEDAIRRIIERQEVMRTSFLPGKERPVQIIRSTGEPVLRFRELDADQARPEVLEEVMAEGFREPFDMVRGPLYRMEMLQRGKDDFVMALTTHHAIADGWTLGAFVQDLCTAYILGLQESGKIPGGVLGGASGIRKSLQPLPMSYSEWGTVERARWKPEDIARHGDYWKARLAGSRRIWGESLPVGSAPDPLRKWVTEIPRELAEAVRGLARQSGATLFSTLLAAFQLTLFRWTGVDDIVVGTPVANRSKAAVRETMGYFAGVVPLRGTIDRKRPFVERLRAVHDETVEAFAKAMPFAELALALGEPSSPTAHSVFDTRFAFQNHPIPDVVLPGISTKLRTSSTGTARFDLGCELTEDGAGFELVWLHRPSVLSAADILELDKLYREVLSAVCAQPEIHPDAMTL